MEAQRNISNDQVDINLSSSDDDLDIEPENKGVDNFNNMPSSSRKKVIDKVSGIDQSNISRMGSVKFGNEDPKKSEYDNIDLLGMDSSGK